MKKPGNNRIPGKNIVPSPIGDRKRYKLVKKVRYNNLEYFVFYRSFFQPIFQNSKSTLKTSLKQATPTPQTDDGIVYGSPRNTYSFF